MGLFGSTTGASVEQSFNNITCSGTMTGSRPTVSSHPTRSQTDTTLRWSGPDESDLGYRLE